MDNHTKSPIGAIRAALDVAAAALRRTGRVPAPALHVAARRLVFGLVVVAAARARARLAESVTQSAALATYFISSADPEPALDEAELSAVASALGPGAAAWSADEVIAAYERCLDLQFPGGTAPNVSLSARHDAGAFFTPPRIVAGLLDVTLEPALERARSGGEAAILDLRICDPSCGPGAFVLAALRRLAAAHASVAGLDERDAAGRVLRRCVYGVDIDLAAVELCRGLAWLETSLSWNELASLHTFRCGDSLLGATPALCRRDAGGPAVPTQPETPRSDEDAWCGAVTEAPGLRFFHWHCEFPDVFSAARGPQSAATGAHGGFDVVVGNPPFLNQLEGGTAFSSGARALLRARFGGAVAGYADAAVAFQLLGLDLLRAGGRCTLIAPLSLLSARDARAARERLATRARLEALWVATEPVFSGTAVRVCAPTLRLDGERDDPTPLRVERRRNATFVASAPHELERSALAAAPTWAPLIADLLGVPAVSVRSAGTIGDMAEATADFRDQFYGLRGFVVEDADVADHDARRFPPLVTTGLVDLASCRWGTRCTRFDGRRWDAPRVDLERLEREGTQGAWARRRLVPKLLVATQTRVIEVVVDDVGVWLPSVPLLTIVPADPGAIWHIAAALASPPVSALAASTYLGAALSVDTIKLSARQLAALPLPAPCDAWDAAAAAFRSAQGASESERAAHLAECGGLMCVAYGLSADATSGVLDWWRARAFAPSRGV